MRTIAVCLMAIFAVSCGDDDSVPTRPADEPEPEPASSIIGTWRNTGNSFSTKLTENYRRALDSQGFSQVEIEATLNDDDFTWYFLENINLVFGAGNSGSLTWPGADGESVVPMQWSIQDGYLVIIAGPRTGGRFSYTVTSARLTLSMTIEDLVVFADDDSNSVTLEEWEELTLEERTEVTSLFQGITQIEYYFERV